MPNLFSSLYWIRRSHLMTDVVWCGIAFVVQLHYITTERHICCMTRYWRYLKKKKKKMLVVQLVFKYVNPLTEMCKLLTTFALWRLKDPYSNFSKKLMKIRWFAFQDLISNQYNANSSWFDYVKNKFHLSHFQ